MYKKLTKIRGTLTVKTNHVETLTLFFEMSKIMLDDSCFLIYYISGNNLRIKFHTVKKKGGNADGCSDRGTVRGTEL